MGLFSTSHELHVQVHQHPCHREPGDWPPWDVSVLWQRTAWTQRGELGRNQKQQRKERRAPRPTQIRSTKISWEARVWTRALGMESGKQAEDEKPTGRILSKSLQWRPLTEAYGASAGASIQCLNAWVLVEDFRSLFMYPGLNRCLPPSRLHFSQIPTCFNEQ